MALPKEDIYTIEDIYALPDGERAELIDGQIYYMAPPSRKPQKLSGEIFGIIREYIRSNHGACEVYAAPFAVYLDEHTNTYELDDRGCTGAPDWIVEIVSPSSKQMDYYKKLFKYRTAGVREYWVVDPDKNLILVYNFEQGTSEQYILSDKVKAGIYENLVIDFRNIRL